MKITNFQMNSSALANMYASLCTAANGMDTLQLHTFVHTCFAKKKVIFGCGLAFLSCDKSKLGAFETRFKSAVLLKHLYHYHVNWQYAIFVKM